MRILVVDDKLERRKWLKELLEKQGHKVIVATEGLAALTRLKYRRFDLVLTDTKMPCLSGPELVEEMRQRHMTTPIIGMSNRKTSSQHYEHFWHKKQPPARLFRLITTLTAEVGGNKKITAI